MKKDCSNITNPISTNSIIEVGINKPACATFEGNTLNEWLAWLASQECSIDWAGLDLTKIRKCLGTYDCDQTQLSVMQTIVAYLDKLSTNCELPSSKKGTLETTKLVSKLVKTLTGTLNVKFLISVKNTGNVTITGINVTDKLAEIAACAFVGITAAPVILTSSTVPLANLPTINGSFNGNSVTGLFNVNGSIAPGEILYVTFEAEINEGCLLPDAPPLLNIVTSTGSYVEGSSTITVSSLSNPIIMVPKVISDVPVGLDAVVVTGTNCAVVTPTVDGYNVDVACPAPISVVTAGTGIIINPTVGGYEIEATPTCIDTTMQSILTDPLLYVISGTPLGHTVTVPIQVTKQCKLVQLSGRVSFLVSNGGTFSITISNPLYRPWFSISFPVRIIRPFSGYLQDVHYLEFNSLGVGVIKTKNDIQGIEYSVNPSENVILVLDNIIYFTQT